MSVTPSGPRPSHRLTTALLLAAAVAAGVAGRPAAVLAAEVHGPAAGSCPRSDALADPVPVELAAAVQPLDGSTPACPAPLSCDGWNPTGSCIVLADLGPCCSSGGATLCCPAGTTQKVRVCAYTKPPGGGVLGKAVCFDRQLSCE